MITENIFKKQLCLPYKVIATLQKLKELKRKKNHASYLLYNLKIMYQ